MYLSDRRVCSHNSFKFVKFDMVEGTGPSMDVPCISLKQTLTYDEQRYKYQIIP